jgi:hypothetical protein
MQYRQVGGTRTRGISLLAYEQSVDHYNVDTNSWRQCDWQLHAPLNRFAACYIAPYLCIFGGEALSGRFGVQECWRMNLLDGHNKWESLPHLPEATSGLSCIVI